MSLNNNVGNLEKIATLIVILSVWTCLFSVMTMRSSTRMTIASHVVRKSAEDEFWLNADKSQAWYGVDLTVIPEEVQAKFIQMFEDDETKEFIKNSVDQSDSWLVQGWYNLAKTVMSLFRMSQTDMNGYLNRGSMFVLSREQFRLLLGHGGQVHVQRDSQAMIDLGAGDGKVTEKLRHSYNQVFATEVSPPMRSLLKAKNISVLPIESWMDQEYDLISCLNLLDRCDNPLDIIRDMHKSLRPDGLLLVALVLPFKPYVESRKSREPRQALPIVGDTFEHQISSVVTLFQSSGFSLRSWTRVPYLCEGDLEHSVYILDDAVFLFNKVQP